MSTLSEKSLNSNGGSADVSHQTHERPRHERHPDESDNVMSLALCTNGQERASVERHPVENNHGSLQSPYAANKEPAKPSVEEDFALGRMRRIAGQKVYVRIISKSIPSMNPFFQSDQ